MIARRYGTLRGMIRLAAARGEVALGRAGLLPPDADAVTRLVFVCHGNICRSAYADVLAREAGLNSASFGLSTTSGKSAHPPALAMAAALGHDLTGHRTARVEDFEPQEGDLLLAMETRQLRRLAAIPVLAQVPRGLLGLHARPAWPHLHDPYSLSDAYLRACLMRIGSAIPVLRSRFPGAALS